MAVETSVQSLRQLVDAIVANDGALFSKLIDGSSALATASFRWTDLGGKSSCYWRAC